MRPYHWLVVFPLTALVGAPYLANRTTPLIFGLPFFLAWTVGAVLLTAGTMAIIHRLDQRSGTTEDE